MSPAINVTQNPGLIKDIRRHYDVLSIFYHWFWGEHIHHGYWQGQESPAEAQINLIRRLSDRVSLRPATRVLDIGCGLGGSSLWLAANRGCRVTGITISPIQAKIAQFKSKKRHLTNTKFLMMDANDLSRLQETFDCVWIIECSEHIEDKERFFRQCHNLLRPGGRLALCTWIQGDNAEKNTGILEEIYAAMLSPSLLKGNTLIDLLHHADFRSIQLEDITDRVRKTWDYCLGISHRKAIHLLLPLMGRKIRRFVHSFELMKIAYDRNIMAYAMVTAVKAD